MNKKYILSIFLLGVVLISVFSIDTSNGLIHSGGLNILKQILLAFFTPEISPDLLKTALEASVETLVYAFAGISIAIVIGLIFGILCSKVVFNNKYTKPIAVFFRALLGLMRAIHELIWAWFFVASIGLSPLSGVFALAIPYGGILGRIYSDMLNDVPENPLMNLKLSGATKLQSIFYGYFPFAFPNMLSYTMYRLECAVRSSAILSFVGLGGIGYHIQMSLQDMNFSRAWSFVFVLIILVVGLDLWSNGIRKRLSS